MEKKDYLLREFLNSADLALKNSVELLDSDLDCVYFSYVLNRYRSMIQGIWFEYCDKFKVWR